MYDTNEYSFGDKEFKEAFTFGNRTFYGGSEARITERYWNAVVGLNERNKNTIVTITIPKYDGVTKCFNLHCYNFQPPLFTREQWLELINELPEGDIAVCCYGGMGRTGTALCILRALLTGEEVDPVAAIRQTYRAGAVESDSQIDYIRDITGLETNCKTEYYTNYLYDADFWHNY